MEQLTKNPRIEVVDALRGFAVMAIILVHNLEHFIFPVRKKLYVCLSFSPAWHPEKQDGFTCREHQRHPAPSWVSR